LLLRVPADGRARLQSAPDKGRLQSGPEQAAYQCFAEVRCAVQ